VSHCVVVAYTVVLTAEPVMVPVMGVPSYSVLTLGESVEE